MRDSGLVRICFFGANAGWCIAGLFGQAAILLNALRGLGYSLQLVKTKVLQSSGLGVEGPIERTDAALAVAGVDPVDQFLIGELVGVTLAVVNVSAINLAMPQDALLGWQAIGCPRYIKPPARDLVL